MIERGKLEMMAQLIEAINDSCKKLEEAYRKNDLQELKRAKKEILNFQNKISGLI